LSQISPFIQNLRAFKIDIRWYHTCRIEQIMGVYKYYVKDDGMRCDMPCYATCVTSPGQIYPGYLETEGFVILGNRDVT